MILYQYTTEYPALSDAASCKCAGNVFPSDLKTYKNQRFSPQCPPWGNLTDKLNKANTTETEYLVGNDSRQKCLDKRLPVAYT